MGQRWESFMRKLGVETKLARELRNLDLAEEWSYEQAQKGYDPALLEADERRENEREQRRIEWGSELAEREGIARHEQELTPSIEKSDYKLMYEPPVIQQSIQHEQASDPVRLEEVRVIIQRLNELGYRDWDMRMHDLPGEAGEWWNRVEADHWDEMGGGWALEDTGRAMFLRDALDWTSITEQDKAILILEECEVGRLTSSAYHDLAKAAGDKLGLTKQESSQGYESMYEPPIPWRSNERDDHDIEH